MRVILLGIAVLALAGPAAGGEPKGLAAAFGNTIRALYPDGGAQRLWLKADGSWEAVGKRGKASSGRWAVKGDKVCLKQARPIALPVSYCTDFPRDGEVGAVWTSRAVTGEPIRLTLVKGFDSP